MSQITAASQKSIKAPYTDFPAQFNAEREEILRAVEGIMSKGEFILGKEVESFEQEFARLCGVPFAVGVGNGTDALILSLKALEIGPGDEVITPPNSWISSTSSIALVGAKPVFADVLDDYTIDPACIEAAITPRTKAIMPVHLTGRCAQMEKIATIAEKHGLAVIEDAAQAAGASYKGKEAGSFGIAGCFSLHPLKNLSGMGDGGVITTKDEKFANKLRLLRNHGLCSRDEIGSWGTNSRLDAIQAAILRVRLRKLHNVCEDRRANAAKYRSVLSEYVKCPTEKEDEYQIYHLFMVQVKGRNELQSFLSERGVETKIHYPVPLHLQPCSSSLGYKKGSFPVTEKQADNIISLPIHQNLNDKQINYVSQSIVEFYKR